MADSSGLDQSGQGQEPGSDAGSLLRQGMAAGRAGQVPEAQRCFRAVLEADPHHVTALLWLAWLAPTRQESLALIIRVLERDPTNVRARNGLRWAMHRPATSESAAVSTGDVGVAESVESSTDESPRLSVQPPTRSELLHGPLLSSSGEQKARSGVAAKRGRWLVGPIGLLLLLAAGLFAAGILLMAQYSPAAVLARVLPTVPVPPGPVLAPLDTPTAAATVTPSHTPKPAIADAVTPPFTASVELSIPLPATVLLTAPPVVTPVPSPAGGNEKWIDVDLTNQRLTAYEGNTPVFEAAVSTGLPNTPTVVGEFRIYWKLAATDMSGPGYYLRDVPYTMYFYRGYALHGTYWHSSFGQPMSHGCVNLSTEDSKWLFDWADPPMSAGARHVRASRSSPGTLVVVHK